MTPSGLDRTPSSFRRDYFVMTSSLHYTTHWFSIPSSFAVSEGHGTFNILKSLRFGHDENFVDEKVYILLYILFRTFRVGSESKMYITLILGVYSTGSGEGPSWSTGPKTTGWVTGKLMWPCSCRQSHRCVWSSVTTPGNFKYVLLSQIGYKFTRYHPISIFETF